MQVRGRALDYLGRQLWKCFGWNMAGWRRVWLQRLCSRWKDCGLVCLERVSGNTRADTDLEKEPRVCLCLRASRSFYLCQDPASVMSGELVCWALGEHEHEKPLFTVWLQHTNICEASLVWGSACSTLSQEGRNVDFAWRLKGIIQWT